MTTQRAHGRTNRWALGLAAAGLLLATAGTLTAQTGTGGTTGGAAAKAPDLSKLEKRDLIIFKNGNKVEGVILEETETTIRFLVIVGTLRTPVNYTKGEILEIKRNEFKPSEPAKTDEPKDAANASVNNDPKDQPTAKVDDDQLVDVYNKPVAPGATKVYVVNFQGELGRDVSNTPVKDVMDDVVRMQPDIVIVRFDHTFGFWGEETVDFDQLGQESYDLLEKARELDVLIMDRVATDPSLKTKPRMVAWIKRALGPGAFLPFVFPEIYFTSDGHHGGIGGLDKLFKGGGADHVVAEKQISLRLARAVGLAEKGGHDGRLMRAMSRGDYSLCYRLVGGKPEFKEVPVAPGPEWFVLKDDGATNPDNADSMQDWIRMRGNDFLTLDARTAFDVELSRGTADTVEDLLLKMGVPRNFAVLKNKSGSILKDWGTRVTKAETDFQKLFRDYQNVRLRDPGGFPERTAYRTQRKNLLRQMQTVVEKYKEAINPRRLRGMPDDIISRLSVLINEIETAQKLDRP